MGTISLSLPSDGNTIDAADVNTPLNTISAVINGNLDDDNVKVGANINGTKLLINSIPPTAGDANMRGGWNAGIVTAMPTVTALGNRSYSLVHATTDLTGYLSPGMRLKLTRTATAPTQCTSLNGTTQYYNKTSPAGLTFTDNFTTSAWIKVSAYQTGVIINRSDASINNGWRLSLDANGAVVLLGLNTLNTNNRQFASYQSVPLNKWVHVAASWATGVGTVYIDGVSVPFATTTAGTAPTTITQGTGDLVVGRNAGASSAFFAGNIAQAAVYSAVLSSATILAAATQTLSGSETSLVSAYSFNGIITDLNANANNLTANGSAVATTLDTPFTQTMTGVTTGTTNYGIITAASFSTNTTLTVQVAEGDTIPTSGGVSAISYSTQSTPYGMPSNDKFTLSALETTYNTTVTQAIAKYCSPLVYDRLIFNGNTGTATSVIQRITVNMYEKKIVGNGTSGTVDKSVVFPALSYSSQNTVGGTSAAGGFNTFTEINDQTTSGFTVRMLDTTGAARAEGFTYITTGI